MFQSRWSCVVLGIVIGAVVAANVSGLWPQIPVHASATHGQENFAIATGPIGVDVEVVYILDYLTGELKAAALNLQTAKFMSFFEHNISKDFPVSGKNPHYLMVTGMADMRKGGQGQLGSSIVYVAEYTSGQIMAYGLPWTASRAKRWNRSKGSSFRWTASSFGPRPFATEAPRFLAPSDACRPRGRASTMPLGREGVNSRRFFLFLCVVDGVQITVNGKPRKCPPATTIAELLADLELPPPQVAVEVNLELIPRGRHAEHRLEPGDRLEVVTLVGGG